MPMPLEIVGLGKEEVRFVWEDDTEHVWKTRDLRVMCTCANCVSEVTGKRTLDASTIPAVVTATDMALVGNYGVSIHFSDGHNTSIFRFVSLLEQYDIRHGKGAKEPFPGSKSI